VALSATAKLDFIARTAPRAFKQKHVDPLMRDAGAGGFVDERPRAEAIE
jgi:hypothetical protein